jgi:hypothetical protein
MNVSTVPVAIDRLVAMAALALPGTDIIDGQPIVTEGDFVAIAFTGIPGEEAVETARTTEQMGAQPDREIYDVTCLASSWDGGGDPKLVRDQAYALVDAFANGLKADHTLGGLAMRARLSTVALAQEQTEQGAAATVRFIVRVDAFTRP